MTKEERQKMESLRNELELMRGDNVQLAKDIESLKRQIGGYKASHINYRKKITELKEQVEHYKQLDLEGDELYAKKIDECDDLKKLVEELRSVPNNVVPKEKYEELEKSIESKNTFIEQLQDRIQKMSVDNAELEHSLFVKKEEVKSLTSEIEWIKRPWWKKLL